MMKYLLCLCFAIFAAQAQSEGQALLIGGVSFQPDTAQIAELPASEADVIAQTMAVFGKRRDTRMEMVLSQGLKHGTVASERARRLKAELKRIQPKSQGSFALRFSSAVSKDAAEIWIAPTKSYDPFCPWKIELQLDGWAGAIEIAAGIENELSVTPELSYRFRANPDVPYSKSVVECADRETGQLSQTCNVFLLASDEPIQPMTLPEIKLALLSLGKGSGAALLPSNLSGMAACQMRLNVQN